MKKPNINITKKEVNLLIIVAGLALVGCAYYFGYQKLNEKKAELDGINATMQQQVSLLQQLTDNIATYEDDTVRYVEEAQAILDTFPVDLMEEDQIMYAKYLDDLEDETFISSISTPRRSVVGLPIPEREDLLVSAQDITGQIAANAYVPDGTIPDVSQAVLYSTTSDLAVATSYNGFKNLVTDLVGWELEGQRRINSVSLAFSDSGEDITAPYMASVNVGFYAMSGFEREYVQPDAGEIPLGTSNIFGNGLENGTLTEPLRSQYPNYTPPVRVEPEPVEEEALPGAEEGAGEAGAEGVPAETAPEGTADGAPVDAGSSGQVGP